jgi:hypothetical protein
VQSSGISSSHSSPVGLSTTDTKIDFQILAGRDRLTSVGNNVIFEVSNAKGEVRFYKNQDKEGASIPANATAEQIEALFVGK